LIIEWPVDAVGDNSSAYMKEVELMELIATISSKNTTNTSTDKPVEQAYTTGIIILDPADVTPANLIYTFTRDVDYRAFTIIDGKGSVSISVENGVDKHRTQTAAYIHYDMYLKVPVYLMEESKNSYIQPYTYSLYNEGVLSAPKYRLYNELDGTVYEEYDEIPAGYAAEERGSEYRLYAVYKLAENKTLENKEDNLVRNDSDLYKIAIDKTGGINDTELSAISFDNKLEIIVEAEFNNQAD
jgi:hypothetical protein